MMVSTTVLLQSGIGRLAGVYINIKAGLELADARLANWQKLSMGLGGLRRQPLIGCYLLVIDEEDDDITIVMISLSVMMMTMMTMMMKTGVEG